MNASLNSELSHFYRSQIPGIHEMHVEGEIRNLGIVKHFKKIPLLATELPKSFSIAWVHLDPDEVLETHTHDVPSMIIAAEGSASSQGDTEIVFHGGDAVFIPAWNTHGFTGGKNGFWGLSIQFNETAIFETQDNPLTQYQLQDLPPLEERQLGHFTEDKLTDKNNTEIKKIIPEEYEFIWHKVKAGQQLQGKSNNQLFITLRTPDHLAENYQSHCLDKEAQQLSPHAQAGSIVWNTGTHNISFEKEDTDTLVLEIRFH